MVPGGVLHTIITKVKVVLSIIWCQWGSVNMTSIFLKRFLGRRYVMYRGALLSAQISGFSKVMHQQ